MSKISNERECFSLRLQQSLRNADHSPDSPTQLARDFNVRFAGNPITVHAARKWLVGEAIPTQDKMRTLANWLGVPIEWLRFGGDDIKAKQSNTSSDLKIIADFGLLSNHDRTIVREFIRVLLRAAR